MKLTVVASSGRAGPSWTTPLGHAALGFASASLGLQGHVAKVSPMFATCRSRR